MCQLLNIDACNFYFETYLCSSPESLWNVERERECVLEKGVVLWYVRAEDS